MKQAVLIVLGLATGLGLAGCAAIPSPRYSADLGRPSEPALAEPVGPPPPFPVERPYQRFCYWC